MKSRSKQFTEDQGTEYLKKEQPLPAILGSGKFKLPPKGLRFVAWNVNGIRNMFKKKTRDMLTMLEVYRPDFFCINETKINPAQFEKVKFQLKLTGYYDYWNCCKISAGYSGVAVYAKYAPKSIFQDLEQPIYSQEGRLLTLQYEYFYLVVLYVPSAGDRDLKRLDYKVNKYEVALHKYFQKLKEKALAQGKNVIICGDFNTANEEIDFHKTAYSHKLPSCTREERASFKKMLDQGWIDTFRYLHPREQKYTWWFVAYDDRKRNIGRRLDYFLVNKEFISCVKESKTCGEVMGSDHCPIFMRIQLETKKTQIKQQKKIVKSEETQPEVQLKIKKIENKEKEKNQIPTVQHDSTKIITVEVKAQKQQQQFGNKAEEQSQQIVGETKDAEITDLDKKVPEAEQQKNNVLIPKD